jgi:hypothetical protein
MIFEVADMSVKEAATHTHYRGFATPTTAKP